MLQANTEPIAGYRLIRPRGTGAFGEVWEAEAPDGTLVALKFLDARTKDIALLRSEIKVLQTISDSGHQNLIRLRSVVASSRELVLCMELADGNLDELRDIYVAESGRHIPPDHLLELLAQAAEGLDFMAGLKLPGSGFTGAGLQHCDIKPTNLLLLGDTVKIADFGLCANTRQKTHHKGYRGTAPYAPPELYYGRPAPTTDQYSLAVTFCDLVSGSRMFLTNPTEAGPRPAIDVTKIRASEYPVLSRALHPDPTRRYPNCRTFIAALREAVKDPRPRRRSGFHQVPPLAPVVPR